MKPAPPSPRPRSMKTMPPPVEYGLSRPNAACRVPGSADTQTVPLAVRHPATVGRMKPADVSAIVATNSTADSLARALRIMGLVYRAPAARSAWRYEQQPLCGVPRTLSPRDGGL